METTLNLLYVGDGRLDRAPEQLLRNELGTAGYVVCVARVDAVAPISEMLLDQNRQPDIAVFDPQLAPSAILVALEFFRSRAPGLPSIVISHGMGEATAVELMRAGARDVVSLDEPSHLLAAVEREIEEARARSAAQRSIHEAHGALRRQRALSEFALAGLRPNDWDCLVKSVPKLAADALGLPMAILARGRERDRRLELIASVGVPTSYVGILDLIPSDGQELGDYLLANDGTVAIDDVASESRFGIPSALQEGGIKSAIFALLESRESEMIVLGVGSRESHDFSPGEREFVDELRALLDLLRERASLQPGSSGDLARLSSLWRCTRQVRALGHAVSGVTTDLGSFLEHSERLARAARELQGSGVPDHASVDSMMLEAKRIKHALNTLDWDAREDEGAQQPVDLAPVVSRTVSLLRPMLPPHVSLNCRCAHSLPMVLASEWEIQELLLDLVMSGISGTQGTDEVIVTLDLRPAADESASAPLLPNDAAAVVLTVSVDSADVAPAEPAQGEGAKLECGSEADWLGFSRLTIRQLIEGQGGRFRSTAAPGLGASFELVLPAALQHEVAAERSIGLAARSSAERAGPRIVLVDDEVAVARLGRRLLGRLGYEVVEFTESLSALDYLRTAKGTVDMVISDYAMPDMNGLDLASRIMELWPEVPVVLTTGYGDGIPQSELDSSGIRTILDKPYHSRDLAELVSRVLASSAP